MSHPRVPQRSVDRGPPDRRPSIYEHVRIHVRSDGPGLLEGGDTLPDEATDGATTPGGIRFAPGAWEGLQSRVLATKPRDAEAAAEEVCALLPRLAPKPDWEQEERLADSLRGIEVRRVVDLVLERLAARPPSSPRRLHRALRRLFLATGHRDVVKLCLAVMATFRDQKDIPLFRTIGRHEEFTLYSAVALSRVSEDPISEWVALARQVDGWGRVELVERLLLEDPRPDVRAFLLREGCRNSIESGYTALAIAQRCRLLDALEGPDLDPPLLRGAALIVGTLAEDAFGGPDGGMLDLGEGPQLTEKLISVFAPHVSTLEDFLHVHAIRAFVASDEDEERLLAAGWTPQLRARIAEQCERILGSPEWTDRVRRAFDSADTMERWQAPTVAHLLRLRKDLVRQVQRTPLNDLLWFYLSKGATELEIRETLDLARSLLNVSSIATGPSSEHGHGRRYETHMCVRMIVQELREFPGLGWDLIRLSFESPVIGNRAMAIQALSAWGPSHLTPEMVAAARRGLEDPDKGIRADCADLIARLENPGAPET